MKNGSWDARIRRANELASVYPFAAEGLRFYSHVASLQRALCAEIEHAAADSKAPPATSPLHDELDLFTLLPKFPRFLNAVAAFAPAPLSQAATALSHEGSAPWRRLLEDFWQHHPASPPAHGEAEQDRVSGSNDAALSSQLLAWIFLQPYAEHVAHRHPPGESLGAPSSCPLCGSRPIVGVLRPEGDGAKKSLVCMLCAHEWRFRRLFCPACGEEREPQLAFYSAPEIPHVRVDVCDTCHTYVKCIDLTKTGLAVPIVDELASLPLDIWAREHGYQKLQINILGT